MINNSTDKGAILIVDDTPTNLEILFDLLSNSGFTVLIAEDGESAIARAEYSPPDLIVLDVLMPEMDGFETCQRLKASELTKNIPIIFMTALSETVDKVKGLSLGAVDYITKPFQHEEVLARIE
ncbi:response regulator, partial [Scytonema sp. NUACC21]